jgi:hypothetical protein
MKKQLKRKMNRTAIRPFYRARQRQGDYTRLSEMTGYSVSHISNVVNGARGINDTLANAMYSISRRRVKEVA